MDLRPPAPSSDKDGYRLGVKGQPVSTSPSSRAPSNGGDLKGSDEAAAPAGSGVKTKTIVADTVVIGVGDPGAQGAASAAANSPLAQPGMTQPADTTESAMATALGSPDGSTVVSGPSSSPTARSPGSRLRPRRRRRRVRLRYLIQAWSVSLVVHVAILSALAAATFTSPDTILKILNFDSALASHRNGEQESLPIYADPDNIPRDRAVGDENASTPGEPNVLVVGDGDGEDGGGVIVAGGVGTGRPSNTPMLRGVGKGRINEGSSLPGVKVDGLGGSPLTLLPLAPAADLSGGGKIAGDPIFDVTEIGVALDQLAREILRHLKDHKLTVVWLFDESASMQDDQQIIRQKFDRVSSELKINVEPGKKSAGALNHAIVGFGQGIDYILEKPREDIDQIGRAIKNLKIDSTGIENTMQAIREVVEHYAAVIRNDRRLLIVLVTDESGDDGADVEEARQALTKYHVPLFVIGRQSLFGFPYAHHRYVDPVTKDIYHPLIRRGPETADLELYQWDGLYDRWDEQPSGFAPYELARLTKDSGGIYFVLPSEEFMRVRRRGASLLDHPTQGVSP